MAVANFKADVRYYVNVQPLGSAVRTCEVENNARGTGGVKAYRARTDNCNVSDRDLRINREITMGDNARMGFANESRSLRSGVSASSRSVPLARSAPSLQGSKVR